MAASHQKEKLDRSNPISRSPLKISNCFTSPQQGQAESQHLLILEKNLMESETSHPIPLGVRMTPGLTNTQTSDLMSLNSTNSLPVIEPVNELDLRSSQLSLTSSTETRTLPHKRGPSPLSYAWQKSTQSKLKPKMKESEDQHTSHLPQRTNCLDFRPVMLNRPEVRSATMEDLPPAPNQVKKNPENVEDCNRKTCLGITEMGAVSLVKP